MSKLWSAISNIAALVISIIAVVFTGLQLHDSHNQMILTMKPSVYFDIEYDLNEPITGIAIVNGGPGPAIIKSLTYYIDRVPFENLEDATQYIKSSHRTAKPLHIHCYEVDNEETLSSGERHWIVEHKKSGEDDQRELKIFADFLDKHFAIKANFCSLLGDCWTKCSTENLCD